ncbi:MAG: DNA mismatch repair endonuclease MutL, partial [Clostridia bacterium]|nr:DNA mismatch repair endonuclease MutL [Clostridia bacterium]
MPKINVLSPQVSNMIAAGEVVERPASVVKELIENSLDAKADNIVVEIKSGGKEYIRVTDNGCGIDAGEVETAFLRHATSKLSKAEDLERITTMGFRGEALAALASVSKVDMFTKTRDAEAGTHITLVAGEKELLQETGCPEGTSIVVRDLFFNVPARFKFMKKDATESAKIEEAVFNAAISAPSVAFTFIKDGKESFSTTGKGRIDDVLLSAYGKDVVSDMIYITSERSGISLSGYIGMPSLSRANRNLQSFFINGRPIRSRTLTVAVDEAY